MHMPLNEKKVLTFDRRCNCNWIIPLSLSKEENETVTRSTCRCPVFTFLFKGGRGPDFQDRHAPGGH